MQLQEQANYLVQKEAEMKQLKEIELAKAKENIPVSKIPFVAKPPQPDFNANSKDETMKLKPNVMKDILQKTDNEQALDSNNHPQSMDSLNRNKDLNDDLTNIKDEEPQLVVKKKIVRTAQ